MSGRVWEIVKTKIGEVRMAKAKEERRERRSRKKKRREEKEEEGKETRKMEVQKIAEEQEIRDKEEEITRSEMEARKLVSKRFYKQIYVFGKKTSEQMPIKKLWDYTIDMKEEFVPRKKKVYLLFREEREEV